MNYFKKGNIDMNIDRSKFLGTGEKNENGETLDEFLDNYNPKDYDSPSVTTDIIILGYERVFKTFEEAKLKLLMIKRKNHPCIGYWALPGGFVEYNEDIDHSATRELEEETSLKDIPLHQLYTWGEAGRDPRTRIITISYMSLVDLATVKPVAGDDAKDACWFDVSSSEKNVDGKIICELHLDCDERDIHLSADVEVGLSGNIILFKTYKEIKNNGIAFDHSRMIVQALQYLMKK